MVILLTDGQGSYSSSYTQQAIANNITVYTVGLGSGVNSDLLTSIATATGGQYYPVSSAGDLPEVFRVISENIVDTDGDDLPDIVETSGFRDGLGNWYTTDPENPDTDGDGLGTLLNALALVPGYGDAAKVTTTTAEFVGKNPHTISAVVFFVVKRVDDSIDVVRKTYGDAIVNSLKSKGLSDGDVIQLVKKKVNLNELHTAYKIGNDVVYITSKQYKHITDRHVTGVIKGKAGKRTDFFPTGNEVRPGVTTPDVMDVQDVDNLIKESIQFGTITKIDGNMVFYNWNPNAFGISQMETLITTEGKLITSYPKAGSNVIGKFD
ncbi:VWA domain-containing protein [uncultured Methanolobus sp.]|uniref:VWA domain-containing protein n=1 Tax=uncultured Methanolobus sp. TaxID=218300 RepID=UPI002AABE20C|nr:VWA domain-containing protein [uncultured Methanolobus sp.]